MWLVLRWWHSVRVMAVNILGLPGVPKWINFTVDTTPPTVQASSLNGTGLLSLQDLSLSVSCADDLSPTGLRASVLVTHGGATTNASVQLEPSPGAPSTRTGVVTLPLPSEGGYVLTVRAVDGAGNVGLGSTLTISVDVTPPVLRVGVGPDRPVYVSNSVNASVVVTVVDANAGGCTLVGTPDATTGLASFPLVSSPVGAGAASTEVDYTGFVRFGSVQGNVTISIAAADPASPPNLAAPLQLWLVHDSIPPVHTVSLAPSGDLCVTASGTTVCSTVAGARFDVHCSSSGGGGGAGVVEAPCHVQWGLVVQQAGTSSCSSSPQGATAAAAGPVSWIDLDPAATLLDATTAAMAAVVEAGGDRAAIQLRLVTRAVDAAGSCAMCTAWKFPSPSSRQASEKFTMVCTQANVRPLTMSAMVLPPCVELDHYLSLSF